MLVMSLSVNARDGWYKKLSGLHKWATLLSWLFTYF